MGCDRLFEAFEERIVEERRYSCEHGAGLRLSVAMLRQRSRRSSGGMFMQPNTLEMWEVVQSSYPPQAFVEAQRQLNGGGQGVG